MYGHWTKSDIKDYSSARQEWLNTYSGTDEILYAMCNKWPDHGNFRSTQAKVRIIGRVYLAGLERKGNKDKFEGIYETIASLFCQNKALLDRELRVLRRFKQPGAVPERILALHGSLVSLLKENTKSKSSFRSFVAKYLHFHAAAVPIFDSRSSMMINTSDWYPYRKVKNDFPFQMEKKYDPVYYKFFGQFLLYYSDLQELKLKPSVKDADYFLLYSYWYWRQET